MPESSLAVTRDDLMREVARFLGWGRNPSTWSDNQKTDAEDVIRRGLRQHYNPPILPGESSAHRWSYLTPIRTMTTVVDQGDYDLPDDFGGLEGPVCYSSSEVGAGSIQKRSDTYILQMRQGQQSVSGFPTCFAISTQPGSGDEPTRFTLMLHPAPSSAFDLRYAYRSNPYNVTASRPYPLGGQPSAQSLVSSCIAAADELLNDNYHGATWGTFLDHLHSAISHDRQEMGPRNLGYNGDPSMGGGYELDRSLSFGLEGVTYEHEGYYFSS